MCIQFFLLSLKLIKFKTPAQIQVGLKIQTWNIASDIFTLFFLAPFLLQYEQFNTFQRPRDMQLFWCLQLRRNNASDLKQIFLWLKPVSNEGLFMVYELGWESKNSAHTSLKKLPLFIGKVSLFNSPNPPPFCREGLLCPGSTREHCVKQMCKLLTSPAVWEVLVCTQPITFSSHVMGSTGPVRKTSSFTYLPNFDNFIRDPTMQ